jgi:predicted nuclease of predicted toxin-antitoxin system
VKFLIDAHLPRRLARRLCEFGHDAVHTLDLPNGNASSDQELIELATTEDRIAVTKDRDFVDSFILRRESPRLLWITTGNVAQRRVAALTHVAPGQTGNDLCHIRLCGIEQ